MHMVLYPKPLLEEGAPLFLNRCFEKNSIKLAVIDALGGGKVRY